MSIDILSLTGAGPNLGREAEFYEAVARGEAENYLILDMEGGAVIRDIHRTPTDQDPEAFANKLEEYYTKKYGRVIRCVWVRPEDAGLLAEETRQVLESANG